MAIEPVYTISSKASGGGRDGEVVSASGQIDLDLRPPKELGGSGEGTNPEELFSAGYAACFLSALRATAIAEAFRAEVRQFLKDRLPAHLADKVRLNRELTKAETAWRLGKRYVQDEALAWGASADAEVEDTTAFKKAGHTKHSGPDAPPPGTREARTDPEADASPPETVEGPSAGGDTREPGGRIVCGRLVRDEA